MAYESDVAGTLTEIVAEEGETLPIGSTIARVGDGRRDQALGCGSCHGGGACGRCSGSVLGPSPAPPAEGAGSQPPRRRSDGSERPKASPLARRIAKERGLDLAQLAGVRAWWSDRQGGRGEGGVFRGWRGEGPRTTRARPQPPSP